MAAGIVFGLAMFFVSVGMLFDPSVIVQRPLELSSHPRTGAREESEHCRHRTHA